MLQSFAYELKGNAISSTNPNVITTNSYRSNTEYTIKKEFMDGLGNNIQSQLKLNSSESIISHQAFDFRGRLVTKYKPYQFATNLQYQLTTDTSTYLKQYYTKNVYHNGLDGYDSTDAYPFIKMEYDNLNRVSKITPEGNPWQQHYISHLYAANNTTDVPGYVANSLYKNTTTDENGVKSVEFKDKFGNLVQSVTDADGLKLITKFEYDILGNVTKSIPPKGVNFSTTYKYNTLGRLIQKTSPDAGTADYLYDKNGNLRLMQDANHKGVKSNVNINSSILTNNTSTGNIPTIGKGKLTLYMNDAFINIYSGTVTLQIKGPSNVVLYTLTASSSNPAPSGSILLPAGEYKYTVQSTAKNSSGGNINIEYGISGTSNYVYVYNIFDKLNRLIETGEHETTSTTSFTQTNADNPAFPTSGKVPGKKYFYDIPSTDLMATGQRNLKGRISFIESYRLGTLSIRTFYSYNEMGNVEWMLHTNLNGYGKKISYTYDLQGNVTIKTYKDYYPGTEVISVINSYDKAGRLSTVNSEYAAEMNAEASYQYFASGKLKRVQLGNAQGVDYRYNERDWLTMINHQNLDGKTPDGKLQDPGYDGQGVGQTGLPGDKFGMIIGYNMQNHIGLPQYQNAAPQWNGNISWVIYRMKDVQCFNTDVVGYTFNYDKANRLRNGDFGYFTSSWIKTNAFDEIIPDAPSDPEIPSSPVYPGYDPNGNIASLKRYNSSGSISDQFTYKYTDNKNQLSAITGTSTILYTYDSNGNVTADPSKNISFVIYDINNLPVTVYTANGSQYHYYYDVNGNRVRKSVVGGSNTYYINGYDGRTEAVSHVPTGSNFTYNIWGNDLIGQVRVVNNVATRYYYLKDHLGNIRMTANAAGDPVSWDDYYPFGSVMPNRSQISSADNRYKFTGKERDTETNYDYFGARYYDSRIARWLQVDPLAEKYPGWSPYNYVLNNPLVYIDPFGMDVYHFKPDGTANGVDKAVWWKPWTWGNGLFSDKDVIDLPNGGTQDWGGQIVAGSIDNAEATAYNFLTAEPVSPQTREAGLDNNVLGPVEAIGLAYSVSSIFVNSAKSALNLGDAFISSAVNSSGKQGLTNVGRALQKHAGRDGSVFNTINFSHKTANQEGLNILTQIMNSKNKIIQQSENGSWIMFDKNTGMGVGVTRHGYFNGFRELSK